jgi:hypothetical protein
VLVLINVLYFSSGCTLLSTVFTHYSLEVVRGFGVWGFGVSGYSVGSSAGPTSHGSEQWRPVVYDLPLTPKGIIGWVNILSTRVKGASRCWRTPRWGFPWVSASCSVRKLLSLELCDGLDGLEARVHRGWRPSPSGLSQYYWASSPSYSLVVVKVLRNGPRLSLLGVVEAVVVVLT